MGEDFGGNGEILFECNGAAGIVRLNRPDALNALTHTMVLAYERALKAWETDPSVERVVLKGEGRAFCAGGDIVDIYRAGKAGRPDFQFFADEYRVNAYVGGYPKPIVSLFDGIVMGGGVGISVHGSHRVFSENAIFAMPEVGIGFFPDVGGSHFLPRLPNEFGMYMALTGARVRWGDALKTGLATNAVSADEMENVLDALCGSGDTGLMLTRFSKEPEPETGEKEFADLGVWFSANAVGHVADCVRVAADGGNGFAQKVLKDLSRNSPTSLAIAFRQLREGAVLAMDDCMRMEFRIVCRMLVGHDFYEGIRAAVIDKDRKPQWRPSSLDAIVPAQIDAYFSALGDKELQLS